MTSVPHIHRCCYTITPLWIVISFFALLVWTPWTRPATAYEPWWVQNHRPTRLWSGPDSQAISFGEAPQWSYFLVVAPQQGSRLYVLDPRTSNYAYVDASAVGPSSPPPDLSTVPPSTATPSVPAPRPPTAATRPMRTPPNTAPGYTPWWVANFEETELWSGPSKDAKSLGRVPQFRRLMVVEPQDGDRLHVWYPETDTLGYLDAAVAGPSVPSVWLQAHPVKVVRNVDLPGRSVGNETYVRNLPVHDDETEIRHAPNNTPLSVRQLLQASDGTEWCTVGDGQYVLASEVRLPRPVDKTLPGRWIDADLSEPAMVTAYEGNRIVYSALAIKGTTANSTPKGTFAIERRVEDETMDSSTLGIPRDAPNGYYLKNVLYTQYFTPDGASLHYNYWLGTFGYAGSHGCLGLNYDDARWFWNWANIGTPVVIR